MSSYTIKRSILFALSFAAVIAVFAGSALAAGGDADYRYRTVKYLGVDAPVEVSEVFDYSGKTRIRLGSTPSSYDVDVELGAFVCSGITLIEVPLERNNGQFIADGLFDTLFVYRRSGVEPARALFNGLVRIDYGGDRWLDARLGRDDCLTLLNNFFAFLKNGEIELEVGTLGEDKPSKEIVESMEALVGLMGAPRKKYDFPPTAIVPPPAADIKMFRIQQIRIPFYTGRSTLGKQGLAAFSDDLLPATEGASEIVIYTPPDLEDYKDWVANNVMERFGTTVRFDSNEVMMWQRYGALKGMLVDAGIDGEIIKAAEDGSQIFAGYLSSHPRAVNAVVELYYEPDEDKAVTVAATVAPVLPPSILTVTVSPPAPDTAVLADIEHALALMPREQVNSFCYARAEELNIVRGHKGELVSNVLADFIGKNGYQLIWQVPDSLDWRIEADFEFTGQHFVDTLSTMLSAFPQLQAVIDEDSGYFVRVRLRQDAGRAINPVESY